MKLICLAHRRWLVLATGVLCILVLFCSTAARADSKKPAPAAKAPAPAKPASAPHSSGGGGTAGHPGGAAGSTHSGPTTSTHTGPTTSSPSGHTTTTTAGGAHTTTTAGHTTTTAGGHTTSAGGAHAANVPGGSHPAPGGSHPAVSRTATGRPAPSGSHTVQTQHGAITRRSDGRVSDVHDARRGMDVHHGLNGGRRVSVERADHSRVVAERGRPGYVERRYNYHGHEYGRRAYYYHGHEYNRYYRGYYYHGAYMNVYAPEVYFAPAFYGWAYNPWAAPINYGWGWGGNPWYGYYGFYFAPYPVYAGPAFWLTDYLISTELAAAYAAQQEAQTEAIVAAASAQPILTEVIKAQIAEEVKAQIALENAESQQNAQSQEVDPASSGIERMMSDGKSHVFVAGSSLDVVDSDGAECALSDGDALQLSAAPASDATDAKVTVLSSKGGKECGRAATVTVTVADLQEMQNHMRETIDQGMKEMQAKQGQGGLPAAPASAKAAPTPSAFAQAAPPPEKDGAADVNQQLAEADKAEQQVAQDAPVGGMDGATNTAQAAAPPPPAPTATVNIAVGQTIDQVTAALGPPITVIDLGAKKIYKYKDMKITFKAGKVSDVE